MSLRRTIWASALIAVLISGDFTEAKSLGGAGQKQSKLKDSNLFDLNKVEKRAALLDANTNGLGADWMKDISLPANWGDAEGAFRFAGLSPQDAQNAFRVTTKRTPLLNLVEGEEGNADAINKLKLLALLNAANNQDIPLDLIFNNAKRNALSGALAYDDLINQPRLLDRETREDGRRYLLWRKITGR